MRSDAGGEPSGAGDSPGAGADAIGGPDGLAFLEEGPYAFLFDPRRVNTPRPELFNAGHWLREGRVLATASGRGTAYIVDPGGNRTWVLRHYRRGGLPRRLTRDRYVWIGRRLARPLRELRWLARLRGLGLPVPDPVAAMVLRSGLWYQGDILTARVPGTPLGEQLRKGVADAEAWFHIGVCIRRFHDAGVYHADLNVENIMIEGDDLGHYDVSLIDFDRVRRIRLPWDGGKLGRLARSVSRVLGTDWLQEDRWARCWARLEDGYSG
jgi:3-deoxy-D-manno-octulosonic acid kinase